MSSAFRSMLPNVFGKNWWNAFQYTPRIMDQSFGILLLDSDLHKPHFASDRVMQPRTDACVAKSGFSEVALTEKEFRVKLDTTHFKPEEVQVKVVDKFVVVHGKHEERTADKEGTVSREFTRRYMLPEGCDGEGVAASWDPEGSLVIIAPRKAKRPADAREVRIQAAAEKPKGEVQMQTEAINAAEKPKGEIKTEAANAEENPNGEVQMQIEAEKPKEEVQMQTEAANAVEKPNGEVQKQTEAANVTEKPKEEVQTVAG